MLDVLKSGDDAYLNEEILQIIERIFFHPMDEVLEIIKRNLKMFASFNTASFAVQNNTNEYHIFVNLKNFYSKLFIPHIVVVNNLNFLNRKNVNGIPYLSFFNKLTVFVFIFKSIGPTSLNSVKYSLRLNHTSSRNPYVVICKNNCIIQLLFKNVNPLSFKLISVYALLTCVE